MQFQNLQLYRPFVSAASPFLTRSRWSPLTKPPGQHWCSLIAQPTYEIGKKATELLLQRIADPGRPLTIIHILLDLPRKQGPKGLSAPLGVWGDPETPSGDRVPCTPAAVGEIENLCIIARSSHTSGDSEGCVPDVRLQDNPEGDL